MPAEILIVDDDPLVGNLSSEILNEAGFSTHLVSDSRLAMAAVKEQNPKLVMLDILMPGIDGLTLLKQIKADPTMSAIKVAVVSAKSFKAEVDRAKSYGADLFIKKPYDVKGFPMMIKELIGEPSGLPSAAKAMMRLHAAGAREHDSVPSLSLEAFGRLFLLDAGRGIVPLARRILEENRFREAWLLLTGFSAGHLSGFGELPLLREDGWHVHVLAPHDPDKNASLHLREALARAKDAGPVKAKVQIHEVREDSYALGPGLRAAPFYANHPGATLGYVLELAGRRVVYSPDAELYGENATALQDYDEKIGRLCRGADLLVHDARWTDEDYAKHLDEGHSSVSHAAVFAADNEIRHLLLIGADHSYPDDALAGMEEHARKVLEEHGSQIPCAAVRDGLTLEL